MSRSRPSRTSEYLEHILEAIERATHHVEGIKDADAFELDTKAQDAVVRTIEIIGEAANKIAKASPDYLTKHPDLPWDQMRAMRNKIIHDYFEVDYTVVWQTVKQDLPALAAQVAALLAQKPDG
jgi:uncharacterized protein with HEPN domain